VFRLGCVIREVRTIPGSLQALGGPSRRWGHRGPRRITAALAAATLVVLGLAVRAGAEPARFVVTSTTDVGDPTLNGDCGLLGICTLRAALQEANSNPGHDTIAFDVPGDGPHRIAPLSVLPSLTDPDGVTIDGYTQPGAAPNDDELVSNADIRIELQGQGVSSFPGLHVKSANNTIRGLAVWNFQDQVRFDGASAHDNTVVGSFIGTDAGGTVGAPPTVGSHGVDLLAGADDNRIGAPQLADRNVISGNFQNGVSTFQGGTDDTVLQNNIIGLRPDGSGALPNGAHGIDLNGGTTRYLIGGTGPREGNVISGNGFSGVEISHGVSVNRNSVIGNLIGTTPGGGAAPGFAANKQFGVYLEGHGDPPCTTTCTPDAHHNTVRQNVIVNNASGVWIDKGQHDNVVSENLIGVLADGTPAGNRANGVAIQKGAFANRIGPQNVIAHNGRGVSIIASGESPASPEEVPTYGNTITANRIFRNSGLGIDLAPIGAVTPTPSSMVNGGVRMPTNESVSSSEVVMRTCPGCRVELYAVVGPPDPAGEGGDLLTSAVADADGVARLTVAGSTASRVVTATATDGAGNTSEFSRNVTVPAAK
jgi:CSLREA domain-containing protein